MGMRVMDISLISRTRRSSKTQQDVRSAEPPASMQLPNRVQIIMFWRGQGAHLFGKRIVAPTRHVQRSAHDP